MTESPQTRTTIVVPASQPMVAVLGARDELLRVVEQAFPSTDISVRGKEITIAGEPGEVALVERFYDVMSDREPELARLHPCDPDGRVARIPRDRFALFLVGWLGGPEDYVAQHGHPRLRMRHAPFAVTPKAKDHWLQHFRAALDEIALPPEQDAQFWDYVTHAAQFMVNSFDET